MSRKPKPEGDDAFHRFYADIYGDRWHDLLTAFAGHGDPVDILPLEQGGFSSAPADSVNCGDHHRAYRMDSASVRAACALVLPESGNILDACAAPGGKSIILASLMPPETSLVSNEISGERRRRLRLVLDQYLPHTVRTRVRITGLDAAAMCRSRPLAFGAILLDAPCSSERHVLADPAHLARWTPARTRNLAFRQWAILSSAFAMLEKGGCLVYSTCSISPSENDGVVARLHKKYGGGFVLDTPVGEGAETTAHGVMYMPDRTGGAGPMYISRIRKL